MRLKWGMRALGAALLSGSLAILLIWGAQIKTVVGPHATVAVPLYPGTDNDSGVVFTNLTDRRANLTIEAVSGDPLIGGKTVERGFILLDGTLRVKTDVPKGHYRLLVKRAYSGKRVGRMGLRATSLRAMRSNSQMRYRPAVRSMRRKPGAAAAGRREVVGPSPTRGEVRAGFSKKLNRPCLGLSGVDPVGSYVWSVVDEAGDFAVGGRPLKK